MQTVDINKELYVPILSALNVDVDMGTGQLMMKYPDRTLAATVGKRNLLLPTPDVLRALPESAIVFHPLSENVARGDSAIQNYLKTLVTFKVTFAITYIAQQLYTIAANAKLHEKLKGDQLTILSILPNADAKGSANLARVLESIEMNKVRLYNVFNKRNGTIGGSTFNRVAVATFPLLTEMLEPKGTLWGHRDVRKGDLKDFKALFDYIVPEWNEKDHYSAASNSMEAPSFQALMLAFIKIMEPLNRIAKIYGEHFKDRTEEGEVVDMAPYVAANTEFQHRLTNLSTYRNVLPVMQGNDGDALAGSTATTQEVVQNPRSVAPAFLQQNIGDDIKVPETQVPQQQTQYTTQQQQNTAPINTQGYVQQQMPNQQQQQVVQQQQNTNSGVAGFGNYSTAAAQQRVQPVYPNYGNQGGYQTQGFNSGVAGFGAYGNGQQMTGVYGNQQNQQQQQSTPTPFDEWNRTAVQQQQQNAYAQQQRIQSNPYTTPSSPNQTVMGFGNYGGGQIQQQQVVQQQAQLVTLANGQQIWVNQFGQQVAPPQQSGFFNGQQQQMYGQQNGFVTPSNPYGVQQIGFKTY